MAFSQIKVKARCPAEVKQTVKITLKEEAVSIGSKIGKNFKVVSE